MDPFAQAAVKIIKEQEGIIGPLAIEQAGMVSGLNLDWDKQTVSISGNKTAVLEKLVEQYRDFFGQTSVEVCREATVGLMSGLPKEEVPELLRY